MSRTILVGSVLLGLGGVLGSGGCGSSVDVKKLYGNYDVQVSAFDKMDETMAVVGEGSDGLLDFFFVYGFEPTATDTNAGIQVKLSGKKLTVAQQPIHVDLATGAQDGMVTGKGDFSGTSFTLTFDVVDASGDMLTYDLTGTQTSGS